MQEEIAMTNREIKISQRAKNFILSIYSLLNYMLEIRYNIS